jgi:hypothetical protein
MYTIYITEVALDAACVSGEPVAQCTDSLAECKDDGGLKCLLVYNFIWYILYILICRQFLWSELGGITFINVILR